MCAGDKPRGQACRFATLAYRANKSQYMDNLEQYMRLALKAQSQCRATFETLALLKNPPVFARQANIAAQQVVNNVTITQPSRAGNLETRQNELLEVPHGERLERRARQAQAIRRWRAWEDSTGPRTAEGKARSSRNADRGGLWRNERALLKALRAALGANRDTLDDLFSQGGARPPLTRRGTRRAIFLGAVR
jgi:hypothetical protein